MKELIPNQFDGCKSFYGKAYYLALGAGVFMLYSYGTPVAAVFADTPRPIVRKVWDGWAATTARHIKSFLVRFGAPNAYKSKSEWLKTPTMTAKSVFMVAKNESR